MTTITIEGARRLLPRLQQAREIIERAFAEAVEAASSPGGQPETSPGDTSADHQLAKVRDLFVEDVAEGMFGMTSAELSTNAHTGAKAAADRIVETIRATGWRGESFAELLQLRVDLMFRGIDCPTGHAGACVAAIKAIDDMTALRETQAAEIERLRAAGRAAEEMADSLRIRVSNLEAQMNTDGAEIFGLTEDVRAARAEVERITSATAPLREAIARYEPQVIEHNTQWPRLIKAVAEITGRAIKMGDPLKDQVRQLINLVHEIEDGRRAAARRRQEAEAALDSCRTTCDSLRIQIDTQRLDLDIAQAEAKSLGIAVEEWKARALKAEAAAHPIEVPLLPADYREALGAKIKNSFQGLRAGLPLIMADVVIEDLRRLGAQDRRDDPLRMDLTVSGPGIVRITYNPATGLLSAEHLKR